MSYADLIRITFPYFLLSTSKRIDAPAERHLCEAFSKSKEVTRKWLVRPLYAKFELEVSQNWGYHFGGPQNKDYSILGCILGSPYFGKLPVLKPQPLHSDPNMSVSTSALLECWVPSAISV